MLLELTTDVFWDTEKPLNQQSFPAQDLGYIAMDGVPIDEEREECLNNNSRPVWQKFEFYGHTLKLTFNYISGPMTTSFQGVEEYFMEVIV